jgi:hypothetical protein
MAKNGEKYEFSCNRENETHKRAIMWGGPPYYHSHYQQCNYCYAYPPPPYNCHCNRHAPYYPPNWHQPPLHPPPHPYNFYGQSNGWEDQPQNSTHDTNSYYNTNYTDYSKPNLDTRVGKINKTNSKPSYSDNANNAYTDHNYYTPHAQGMDFNTVHYGHDNDTNGKVDEDIYEENHHILDISFVGIRMCTVVCRGDMSEMHYLRNTLIVSSLSSNVSLFSHSLHS